jgi:phospholipase/carboxylesterase
MVVLHGLGDSLEGYLWLPAALDLPWLNYLLVDAPDPYYGGYSWYDFAGLPEPGIRRSRALLMELLNREVTAGTAPADILLFGFSQGCLMTLEVGWRYPQRLAGLIGISGYIHHPERLIQQLSPAAVQQQCLLTHGTLDPLIPIDRVRPQVRQLQQAGLSIRWKELAKPHTIAGEEEIALIRQFVEECYVARA